MRAGVPAPRASAASLRLAIVASRFHEGITNRLYQSALKTLRQLGAPPAAVETVWVPGAFELPLAAKRLAQTGRFDAVICLGVVVRGETPHFEFVAAEAARGISRVALETGIPVTFGVLTTDTMQQARDRIAKGGEAASAAVEMANLLRPLAQSGPVEPKASNTVEPKASNIYVTLRKRGRHGPPHRRNR